MTSRGRHARQMTVRFEIEADGKHLPTALASMIAKYTRELLMARFQAWFAARAPQIKPTAGYAKDGQRFWAEIEPMLGQWAIRPEMLRRMS
jgi:ribonuclease HII